MKLLLDMNMSPQWVEVFTAAGIDAIHWSAIGAATASDIEIMGVARSEEYVILTHDLDFGILLAVSGEPRPSVVQLRDQDIMPGTFGSIVVQAIEQCRADLNGGALLTIDAARSRVTALPLRS